VTLKETIVVMNSRARLFGSVGRNGEHGVHAPVFHEPWEAQAFALALSLNERGVFSWNEWAATLGEEIRKAQAGGDPDSGATYYRHWLSALERIVTAKGFADAATLARAREAWRRACERTPHGAPIELRPADFNA
jgi:nitrile hydratase accessory protein